MSRAKTDDAPVRWTQRWDVSWADVEQAQLETMLAATPAQRLAWLEEAMRLAYASGALRTDRVQYPGAHRAGEPGSPASGQTASRSPEQDGDVK